MIEIKAPIPWPAPVESDSRNTMVFLAGSIEMGTAEHWQMKIVNRFKDVDNLLFLNPRRDDWDSSWTQSIDNPQFCEQVNWELNAIAAADIVIFYFDPATKSPITLMELGLIAGWGINGSIVCCPDGFWRKGNVDILCERSYIPVKNSLDELITVLDRTLRLPPLRYDW